MEEHANILATNLMKEVEKQHADQKENYLKYLVYMIVIS